MSSRPAEPRIEGTDVEIRYGVPGEDRDGLEAAELDVAFRWASGAVAGKDVLVVGSGRGHGVEALLASGASSLVGVDPDERAVDAATRLYGERASFIVGEPAALPLATGSFDVVASFGAIEGMLDPEAALAEFRRVLVEDGILLAALPLPGSEGELGHGVGWHRLLAASFPAVRLYRRRVALAAAVAPADAGPAPELAEARWLAGDAGEDRTALVVAGAEKLPDLPSAASLVSFRDLRAQQETLAAWELRARQAEADGSAKHWELVASREAQRRLRKRLYALEHRPLRVLFRILRGKPAKLGEGPPIRASEMKPQRWD